MYSPTSQEIDILYRLYQNTPTQALEDHNVDQDKTKLVKVITKLVPLTLDECNIVDKLFNHFAGKLITDEEIDEYELDDPFNAKIAIRDWLMDKKEVLRYFLECHSLLSCHILEKSMDALAKGSNLFKSDFEQKFLCECNKKWAYQTGCCSNCGRSSKTWKLVSGRNVMIKKITKRLILPDIVETFDLGFEVSEFEQ